MVKFEKLLPVAHAVGNLSKDPNRKVGALIVGPDGEIRATGYNGFARKVREDVPERHEKPEKFFWTCHAEENAIAQAARSGVSTNGCVLITTLFPCTNPCARMIIQSGIKIVYAPSPDLTMSSQSKWLDESRRSLVMFDEAAVQVIFV